MSRLHGQLAYTSQSSSPMREKAWWLEPRENTQCCSLTSTYMHVHMHTKERVMRAKCVCAHVCGCAHACMCVSERAKGREEVRTRKEKMIKKEEDQENKNGRRKER